MAEDIQVLKGKQLEHAFIRAAYKRVIGSENDDLLVSIVASGAIAVFADKEHSPEIVCCDLSGTEALVAFNLFQSAGAGFEIGATNTDSVLCRIHDITAGGRTYLEAGMRAYVMYAERKKTTT